MATAAAATAVNASSSRQHLHPASQIERLSKQVQEFHTAAEKALVQLNEEAPSSPLLGRVELIDLTLLPQGQDLFLGIQRFLRYYERHEALTHDRRSAFENFATNVKRNLESLAARIAELRAREAPPQTTLDRWVIGFNPTHYSRLVTEQLFLREAEISTWDCNLASGAFLDLEETPKNSGETATAAAAGVETVAPSSCPETLDRGRQPPAAATANGRKKKK